MRHLVFLISSLFGGIITMGILPQAPVFGLQPDFLLVFSLCLVLIDETPVPIVYTCIITIGADLLYTGSVGAYSVPYAVVLLISLWVLRGKNKDRIVAPVLTCLAAWLVKDCISAFMIFLEGNVFNFGKIFVEYTLPETLINCILMLIFYQVFYLLLNERSTRSRRHSGVDMPKSGGFSLRRR